MFVNRESRYLNTESFYASGSQRGLGAVNRTAHRLRRASFRDAPYTTRRNQVGYGTRRYAHSWPSADTNQPFTEEEVKRFAIEYLVTPGQIKEKKSRREQEKYLEKKRDKYGIIYDLARTDYIRINQNFETHPCVNLSHMFQSVKDSHFDVPKKHLLKAVRKSRLELYKAADKTQPVVFDFFVTESGSRNCVSVIAYTVGGGVSIQLWSGEPVAKSKKSSFLGRGEYGSAQKVRVITEGIFKALKTSSYDFDNDTIENEVAKLGRIHSQEVKVGLQLPVQKMLNLPTIDGKKVLGYLSPLYNKGSLNSKRCREKLDILGKEALTEVFLELLVGLKSLHDMGIVHGDIKPENCFVNVKEEKEIHLYLADLGDAKSIDELDLSNRFNELGTVGTVGYFTDADVLNHINAIKSQSLKSWLNAIKSRDVFAVALTICKGVSEKCDVSPSLIDGEPSALQHAKVIEEKLGKDIAQMLARALSEEPASRPSLEELIRVFDPTSSKS